jgi:hypothetical protein
VPKAARVRAAQCSRITARRPRLRSSRSRPELAGGRHLHRRERQRPAAEAALPDLVDRIEFVEVGVELQHADDVMQRRAGCLAKLLDVVDDVFGLDFSRAHRGTQFSPFAAAPPGDRQSQARDCLTPRAGYPTRPNPCYSLVDGSTRIYRDRKDMAIESATCTKTKTPHAEVTVRDAETGEAIAVKDPNAR